MWISHRKMTPENQGLSLLKDNSAYLTVPDDWREKVKIPPRPAKQSAPVEITPEHKRIIEILQSYHEFTTVWIPEVGVLLTHTKALERCASENKIRGGFPTNSEGTDPSKPNCFLWPMDGGAFRVVRYGKGTKEHETWTHGDWTWRYFNRQPTLTELAQRHGGVKLPGKNEYQFDFANAKAALQDSGCNTPLPYENRRYTLWITKDGTLAVRVSKKSGDNLDWADQGRHWGLETEVSVVSPEAPITDHVRAILLPNGDLLGFIYRLTSGRWAFAKSPNLIESVLCACGVSKCDLKEAIGQLVRAALFIVAKPFQPQFPAEGECNWRAPQLAFDLAPQPGPCPHWEMILDHLGWGLNEAVKFDPWCRSVGITTGRDYLFQWIIRLFRRWDEPLPFLFFYGPNNSGKSALHEGLRLLFRNGYGVANAKVAVRNKSDFNGELVNAILYYIEELNLGRNPNARAIIKEWIVGDWLTFHGKGKTPYEQKNTLHGIQCSNDLDASPIEKGDEKIVAIFCRKVPQPIQRAILHGYLADEAPNFLHAVFNANIANKKDERLGLPPLMTDLKRQILDLDAPKEEVGRTDYGALASIVTQTVDVGTRFTTNELLEALPEGPWPSHYTRFGSILTDDAFLS